MDLLAFCLFSRRLLLDLLAAEEELELRQLQLGQVVISILSQVKLLQELRHLDEVPGGTEGGDDEAEKEALLLAELAAVVQVDLFLGALLGVSPLLFEPLVYICPSNLSPWCKFAPDNLSP